MVRKLAPVVALVLMALSVTALGLGLGDIHTRSALNQNFNADLELLSVDPADIDSLRVTLASAAAFERAGVDRPFFLAGLKFTPMLDEAGKTVIRVTSRNPIREPFLNFLVEVNWPKGRLVREYTVLLDPPTTLSRRPPEVKRAVASPARTAPASAPAAVAPAGMPQQYGPVQDNETLWSIARKLRLDGASLTQTIMALYKANPDAFVNGDINRLKRGRILRVPTRDEVMGLSRREADAAFRAEQDALAVRTTSKSKAGETAEAVTETAAPEAAPAAVDDAKLRIATARPEGEGKAGAGEDDATRETSGDLNNALMLAREEAETARQESAYLRGRVESMEQQVELLKQRLLNIKDEELAQLQAGLTEQPEAAAPAAETTAEEQAPAEPVRDAALAEVEPAPEQRREQGLLGMLADNIALVGAAVAAVLALVILLLLRRRKTEEAAETADVAPEDLLEESILMEVESPVSGDESAVDAAPAGNDTSFLSEFSPSDMHALADETSEVDPVSEADVYIAYGRYDQAEELLDQALSREPERMALKFKLLEVYYANRNAAAYTACAQELADAGQDGVDPGAWQRVCTMGRELAPDYPLFASAAAAAGDDSLSDFAPSQPAEIESISALNPDTELELPTDEPVSQPTEAGEEGPETGPESVLSSADITSEQTAGESEMDLTLDLDDLSMSQSMAADESSLEGLESIDLELPDLDHDPGRQQAASDASDDSLIMALNKEQDESAAEELDAESLQAQLDELSDLTDLEDELSQLSADIEGLDKSLGLEEAEAVEAPAEEEVDIPAPFQDEMEETDEVQTKLDLAIAFVEMGDKEGARSILDEVRGEGSEEQKSQAEKLLADLDA